MKRLKCSRKRKSYRIQKITSATTDLKVIRKILCRCCFLESSVNECCFGSSTSISLATCHYQLIKGNRCNEEHSFIECLTLTAACLKVCLAVALQGCFCDSSIIWERDSFWMILKLDLLIKDITWSFKLRFKA